MFRNPYVKLNLAIFIWGGGYQVAHHLAHNMETTCIGFIRYLIASIILIIIHKRHMGYIFDKEEFKKNWIALIGVGAIGIGLYNMCFFAAEKYLSGSMIAIIFSLNPCITALLAALIFRQRIRLGGFIGMIIALLGAIGVVSYANPECGQFFCSNIFADIGRGQILTLILCFLAAGYSIFSKIASKAQVKSLTITMYASVVGTIWLFFATLFIGDFDIIGKTMTFWSGMLYMSIFTSVLGYFWFSEAINELGVAKSAVFINGIPLSAVLIGTLLLGETISLSVLGCGILIIIGVLLTNRLIN